MDFTEPLPPHRFINAHMQPYRTGQFTSNVPGNAAWPAANRAIYVPVAIPIPFSVRRMFVINGATLSGNFDIGLYTIDGTRLRSSGSTAQTGANTLQYVSISEVLLNVGVYYLALSVDNGTATFLRTTNALADCREVDGIVQQASAFPLPASMTPVTITTAYVPFIGCTLTDSGF